MSIRNKLYITLTLCILGTYISAQKLMTPKIKIEGKEHSVELTNEHLIGKAAAIEVYIYSENDLTQSSSDTITWWSSNPETIIFIKADNLVKSYSFSSELSFAIYDLFTHFEKNGEEKELFEIINSLLELLKEKENVNEIKYETVGNERYGYWIFYWFHYYLKHDYGYWNPNNQNIAYSPVSIFQLSSHADSESWNKKVMNWQQTTYGRISDFFHIYSLNNSALSDKCLLLESIFENNVIRYDLILESKGTCYFFLPMNSFHALFLEFSQMFEMNSFLKILKALCLIDMFYT